eukprot:Rhum_TRINITY_DN21004_c0_g1::Rhum_TRINITY_DN21004_c0_g1_i1::g.172884::m.172884
MPMRFVAVPPGLPTVVSLSSPMFPQLLLDDQLVQQQLQVATQVPLQFACVPGSFGQVHPSALCPMPLPQGTQCLQASGSPWQAASNNDIVKEKSRKKKHLGAEMSNVYVVTLPDSTSTKSFMEKMPSFSYPVVIERFVAKELLFFQADLLPQDAKRLSAKKISGFRPEVRRSCVLILTIKNKPEITLTEALTLAGQCGFLEMDTVELVAVQPRNENLTKSCCHTYIQFSSANEAMRHLHTIDSMPFGTHFVHSSQLDLSLRFHAKGDSNGTETVWHNPNAASRCRTP